MYDPQAKKLNGQSAVKEIVVEISARQLSAKSEALQQMSLFLTQAVFMKVTLLWFTLSLFGNVLSHSCVRFNCSIFLHFSPLARISACT